MKLIDFSPDVIAALLDAAEAKFAPPAIAAADLATEAGRLKHAEALGRYSAIAELRAAYNGAIRSNSQSKPTTSP